MPFKSKAQRRKFYAMADRGEISDATVERWEDETPKGKKLPERVKKAIQKLSSVEYAQYQGKLVPLDQVPLRQATEDEITRGLLARERIIEAMRQRGHDITGVRQRSLYHVPDFDRTRTKTAEPPPPKGVSADEWDRILQKGAIKKVTKQIKLSMARPMSPDQYINKVIGQIKFPKREHQSIRERLAAGLPALTTRVSKERGRYTMGQILNTPWGDRVQVTRINKGRGYTKHPYLRHLTTGQRNAIRRRKYDLVEFQKVGGTRIDVSTIAGQGLIANTPYEAGDMIGPAIDKVPFGGDLDEQYLQTAQGRYVNHSETPNAELVPLHAEQWGLRAKQDIGPEEEVTVDYRTLPNVIPGLSVPIPGEDLLENIKKAAYHLCIRKVVYGVNLTRRGP
jgi:hypothetical protein